MTGIVPCSACVFKGIAKDKITSVCRSNSPVVSAPPSSSGENNHVLAFWPAIDPDNDGCGAGRREDEVK